MPTSIGSRKANASLGFMNLKMELKYLSSKNKNNLHVQFHCEKFVVMLAYLADVFGHLNNMSLSLQGRDATHSDVEDKLGEITARMGVWQAQIKIGFLCCKGV